MLLAVWENFGRQEEQKYRFKACLLVRLVVLRYGRLASGCDNQGERR